MQAWEERYYAKQEAREEGLAEGRAEGRAEGFAEGDRLNCTLQNGHDKKKGSKKMDTRKRDEIPKSGQEEKGRFLSVGVI